jgi:hypothetical protein
VMPKGCSSSWRASDHETAASVTSAVMPKSGKA